MPARRGDALLALITLQPSVYDAPRRRVHVANNPPFGLGKGPAVGVCRLLRPGECEVAGRLHQLHPSYLNRFLLCFRPPFACLDLV